MNLTEQQLKKEQWYGFRFHDFRHRLETEHYKLSEALQI